VPSNTFCSGAVLCLLPGDLVILPCLPFAMGSSIPPVVHHLGLVPTTTSSYRFPPSGLAVNVRHSDGCPNSSEEFGLTLVERVSRITFELVSEFELVVNSVLAGSGCTDCHVLRDDTFGLFARHHTPGSSLFSPSQDTNTQGTGSLFGEVLEHRVQGSASASQFRVATVGKNFSASPSCSPALPVAVRPRAKNPLSRRHFPSRSPIGDLSSSERILYRGIKLDDSADSTYSPPAARPVGSIRRMFDGKTTVDPVNCTLKDASMMMADGKTTESDGLGDSKHAGPSCVAGVVGSSSTNYGSMPPLPSTLADTVSMDVAEDGAQDVPIFDDFSDVATSDVPMAVGGGKNSNGTGLGDSQHASPEDSPDPMEGTLLIDLSREYSQFSDVGHDVRQLSLVIVMMGNVIRRLEQKVHDLEDGVDSRKRAALPAVSVPAVPVPAVPAS